MVVEFSEFHCLFLQLAVLRAVTMEAPVLGHRSVLADLDGLVVTVELVSISLAIMYIYIECLNIALIIDVNECNSNNGGCSQRCINTAGSFYCSCYTGYRLDSNRRSCSGINLLLVYTFAVVSSLLEIVL